MALLVFVLFLFVWLFFFGFLGGLFCFGACSGLLCFGCGEISSPSGFYYICSSLEIIAAGLRRLFTVRIRGCRFSPRFLKRKTDEINELPTRATPIFTIPTVVPPLYFTRRTGLLVELLRNTFPRSLHVCLFLVLFFTHTFPHVVQAFCRGCSVLATVRGFVTVICLTTVALRWIAEIARFTLFHDVPLFPPHIYIYI